MVVMVVVVEVVVGVMEVMVVVVEVAVGVVVVVVVVEGVVVVVVVAEVVAGGGKVLVVAALMVDEANALCALVLLPSPISLLDIIASWKKLLVLVHSTMKTDFTFSDFGE